MRGAPQSVMPYILRCRFIPAHAGSTSLSATIWHNGPVHPRACGEHFAGECDKCKQRGSSPRMRGALNFLRAFWPFRRFIPAHAGSTVDCRGGKRCAAVHPRACGEHFLNPASEAYISGSSPRMRGARARKCQARARSRFIPAHAGSTLLQIPL